MFISLFIFTLYRPHKFQSNISFGGGIGRVKEIIHLSQNRGGVMYNNQVGIFETSTNLLKKKFKNTTLKRYRFYRYLCLFALIT